MTGDGGRMSVIRAQPGGTRTIQGADHGASISLILDESDPGQGPRLHRHAYDETWVVEEGNLSFRVGESVHDAGPGDVLIAPAGAPHKFTNQGPGRSRVVCIHASPTVLGEWLE